MAFGKVEAVDFVADRLSCLRRLNMARPAVHPYCGPRHAGRMEAIALGLEGRRATGARFHFQDTLSNFPTQGRAFPAPSPPEATDSAADATNSAPDRADSAPEGVGTRSDGAGVSCFWRSSPADDADTGRSRDPVR